MLTNYFKLAFRALWRRKFTTGLNIFGLSLGMTAFLFLMEFASFHAGFDRFHQNADRIYRIVATTPNGAWTNVPPALLLLKEQAPIVESTPAFLTSAGGIVQYKPQTTQGEQTVMFKEENVAYGNNDIFQTFSLPFLAGRAELDKPNTMVLTEETAQKYFRCSQDFQSVLGKSLTVTNQFGIAEFSITGVIRAVPEESFLRGSMVFSLQTLANPANLNGNSWAKLTPDNTSAFLDGFVLLKKGANPHELETILAEMQKKSLSKEDIHWHLQSLTSIHTGASFGDPLPNDGMLKLVVVAASIALFVLALALINYINISTAFGLSRAREIGVRKTIGASRVQLILPYFLECLLLTGMSLLLALTIVELLQVPFNTLVGVKLSLRYVMAFGIGSWAWLAILLGTILSGGYVALVLTGVDPIVVLRGNFARSKRGSRIRQTLVIAQFTISIAFIIGTIIVFQQLNFMRHQDLGMKLEQLLVINGPELLDAASPKGNELSSKALAFKHEAARLPFVQSIAASQNIPGQWYNFSTVGFKRPSSADDDMKKQYFILLTDPEFFKTYDMTFLSGKGYVQNDNLGNFKFRNVVVNEAATLQLGFRTAQEATGQFVQWEDQNGEGQRFQIGGVIKNYHHKSLKTKIEPMILLPSKATSYFTVRLATSNLQENLLALERLYKNLFPGNQFSARFADDIFQKQYEDDARIGNVFALFTVVAIGIACLGLFGLVAYSVEVRTKEIGMRKVLGASDVSIIGLLSKDFLKLVFIACLLASPLAWWLMNSWLQDFAYRTPIGTGAFAGAALGAVGVAFATIAFQAWKAAKRLPIESLRQE